MDFGTDVVRTRAPYRARMIKLVIFAPIRSGKIISSCLNHRYLYRAFTSVLLLRATDKFPRNISNTPHAVTRLRQNVSIDFLSGTFRNIFRCANIINYSRLCIITRNSWCGGFKTREISRNLLDKNNSFATRLFNKVIANQWSLRVRSLNEGFPLRLCAPLSVHPVFVSASKSFINSSKSES